MSVAGAGLHAADVLRRFSHLFLLLLGHAAPPRRRAQRRPAGRRRQRREPDGVVGGDLGHVLVTVSWRQNGFPLSRAVAALGAKEAKATSGVQEGPEPDAPIHRGPSGVGPAGSATPSPSHRPASAKADFNHVGKIFHTAGERARPSRQRHRHPPPPKPPPGCAGGSRHPTPARAGAGRDAMTLGVTAGAAPSSASSLAAPQSAGGDERRSRRGPCSAVRAPAASPAGKRVSGCGSRNACNAVLRDPPYTHHLNYLISPNCCTFINH